MTFTRAVRRSGASVVFFLSLTLGSVAACQAAPAVAAAPDAATSHLEHLAETGRFDEVLSRLKTDYAGLNDEHVASLIGELEQFDQSEQARSAQRVEAFDKAMAKVTSELQAGRLEDALIAAIDAHSLADTPQDVLDARGVRDAVKAAEERARAAENAHDWVEALTLYRALDLLYDDYATYRDPVKRVAKHVQVLQLYNPKKLQELYKAQEERRAARAEPEAEGEESKRADKEPVVIEAEPWQSRLKDIEVSMLRQTLAQAARQHVDSRGYAPLLQGSVDSLLVMLDTDDLEPIFPSFANKEKREKFRNELRAIRDQLQGQGEDASLNFLDTASLIDRILKLNETTLNLPQQVIVYELAEGATSTLDDFSAVIWPEEREQFSRSTQGKFYGVGIQISRRDGRLIVVTPLPDTPAQRAGIKAGDVIAEVDGRSTAAWSLDKAVREITGPEGTTVRVGIERVGEKDLLQIDLKRAEIAIESIRGWQYTDSGEWDYWIDPEHRIGYVRLSQFIPQTADDLDAAIEMMQKDGQINGLILDLRFNPGGLLSSAIDVVDRFVKEGPIVYTVDAEGNKSNQSRAHGHHTYEDFPVVVLINQGSASASEIVSGALQDYGRALIIGTRSFGKGSVQDLFPLAQGKAYLKLTTQYYMLPMGRIIHRKPDAREWGILPDLVVDMTNQQVADSIEYRQEVDVLRDGPAEPKEGEEPKTAEHILAKGMDPQLSASLLVLKTRLVARDIAIAQARAEPAAAVGTP